MYVTGRLLSNTSHLKEHESLWVNPDNGTVYRREFVFTWSCGMLDDRSWSNHRRMCERFGCELVSIVLVGKHTSRSLAEMNRLDVILERHFAYDVKLVYRTKCKIVFERIKCRKRLERSTSI